LAAVFLDAESGITTVEAHVKRMILGEDTDP